MPDNLDLLALGQTLGQLTNAIQSNVRATDENTRALSEVKVRLAQGDGEISALKKDVAGLPCKTTPPAPCPTQTVQVPIPPPQGQGQTPLVKIAPEGWVVSWGAFSCLAARHWPGALIGVLGTGGIYSAWHWLKYVLTALAQQSPPPLPGN